MVIGPLIFRRLAGLATLVVAALLLLAVRAMAGDQVLKTDGTVISGQITGVADGMVTVQSTTSRGGSATVPYPLSDIKSVTMAVPPAVTTASTPGTSPAAVVSALEPVVRQFAGLPTDWVVGAMAQLAEAYSAQGQEDKAVAVYNQIVQLYPGSAFENVAKAGKAEMSLKAGKIDEALAAVQPMVDQANKDIAPSPADGALYAKAFLVYGQVLEKKNQPQQALEAYLTVKTMFYQNPALVDQAEQLAKALRDQYKQAHNTDLGID
jgi:tetratricopeptide (TPR) repeat protein